MFKIDKNVRRLTHKEKKQYEDSGYVKKVSNPSIEYAD